MARHRLFGGAATDPLTPFERLLARYLPWAAIATMVGIAIYQVGTRTGRWFVAVPVLCATAIGFTHGLLRGRREGHETGEFYGAMKALSVQAAASALESFRSEPDGVGERSLVRRSIDLLLSRYPFFDLVEVDWLPEHEARNASPWVLVTFGQRSAGEAEAWARWRFAIWKTTGAVHRIEASGAVSDDPIAL